MIDTTITSTSDDERLRFAAVARALGDQQHQPDRASRVRRTTAVLVTAFPAVLVAFTILSAFGVSRKAR